MTKIDYRAISDVANMRDVAAALGMEVDEHGNTLCPFHRDSRPSLHLYPDGYHCFACGAHGDAIDLVECVKGCSKDEAAKIVAYIAGAAMIEMTDAEIQARKAEETDRQRRDREYAKNWARLVEITNAIDELENVCHNAEPYSAAWCDAYDRLNKLYWEAETVDNALVAEGARRQREKLFCAKW